MKFYSFLLPILLCIVLEVKENTGNIHSYKVVTEYGDTGMVYTSVKYQKQDTIKIITHYEK